MQTASTTGPSTTKDAAKIAISACQNEHGIKPTTSWWDCLRAAVQDDLDRRGTLPDLDPAKILKWAIAHRARTSDWPTPASGAIPEAPGETWLLVEAALTLRLRGFRRRTTIRRMIEEHQKRSRLRGAPQFTIQQILDWADAWHARTGKWPVTRSGKIPNTADVTWCIVNFALRQGRGGLPIGASLERLLARQRGVRRTRDVSRLDIPTILRWAEAHYTRTGNWPTLNSGQISECPGETWWRVNRELGEGLRGLPGGSSLARLLGPRRAVRINSRSGPPLTEHQVMHWADRHYDRSGRWPNASSGPIREAVGETWRHVDYLLRNGGRGLPGGSSIAKLRAQWRNVPNKKDLPSLSVAQILGWADDYHARTGKWPNCASGRVAETRGETWITISFALQKGIRGLPGGFTLAVLLQRERGVRNTHNLPRLRESEILAWADAHRARHGQWPTRLCGPIPEAPGETWFGVNMALHIGYRGLPGGTTLKRFLDAHAVSKQP
jgi:hypothetical protein